MPAAKQADASRRAPSILRKRVPLCIEIACRIRAKSPAENPENTQRWYRNGLKGQNGASKKTFIVALARKVLIALSRLCDRRRLPRRHALANA